MRYADKKIPYSIIASTMEDELECFYKHVKYLKSFVDLCSTGKNILYMQDHENIEFFFTLENIDVGDKGHCARCRMQLPSVSISGEFMRPNMSKRHRFYSNLDTYNFYSCECEKMPPLEDGEHHPMFFRFCVECIDGWENIVLDENICYTEKPNITIPECTKCIDVRQMWKELNSKCGKN